LDTAVPREELQAVFDRSTRMVTEAAGIRLETADVPWSGEVCTVYTTFEKGFHSCMTFCADQAMFTRLARRMMYNDPVNCQDIADFAKEYFNTLCGHIVSALYGDTHVAARFQIPSFCCGRYCPCDQLEHIVLRYTSDQNECAQLTCYKSPVPEAND